MTLTYIAVIYIGLLFITALIDWLEKHFDK